MKLWELRIENGFDVLYSKDDNIKEIMSCFIGSLKSDYLEPIELITIEEGLYADIVSFSKNPLRPIFTQNAVNALQELMKDSVEMLPVKHPKYDCYIINIVDVVDCLNYKGSKICRWGTIEKYDIIEERVNGHHIFLVDIRERKTTSLIPLVSDEFKQRVLSNGLKGLRFRLAWDSDSVSQRNTILAEKNPSFRLTEKEPFKEHIQRSISPISKVIEAPTRMFTEIDIYHLGPNENLDKNTIVTLGNSYFKMHAPSTVDSAYAEIMMHIPSSWNVSKDMINDPEHGWPLKLLMDFGKQVMRRGFWLGQWFVFPNQPENELINTYGALFGAQEFDIESSIYPYSNQTDYCGVIITPPHPSISNVFKMKYSVDGKIIEGEWPVYFHTLLPVYKDEIMFYFRQGKEKFVQELMRVSYEQLFDLNRRRIC